MTNFSYLLSAWHSLFRTEHAVITFIGVLVGELLTVGNFSTSFFFPAVGPALITLAAFALNDYFGYETDKANKRKDRPLVGGQIQKSYALYAAVLLFVVGLAAMFFVNQTVFLISFVYVLLSLLYDQFLKKLPLLGNIFIAITMAGPFIYGNLAVSSQLSSVVLLISSIAFLAGIGRELLITLRDVKGDKKIGATTLPMLIGSKSTVYLSAIFILVAVALSFVPILNFYNIVAVLPHSPILLYSIFLVPCDALLFLTVSKALKNQDNLTLKKCRNYTLLALLFGVVAFLLLGLM